MAPPRMPPISRPPIPRFPVDITIPASRLAMPKLGEKTHVKGGAGPKTVTRGSRSGADGSRSVDGVKIGADLPHVKVLPDKGFPRVVARWQGRPGASTNLFLARITRLRLRQALQDAVQAGGMWVHANQALLHGLASVTPALSALIASGALILVAGKAAAGKISAGIDLCMGSTPFMPGELVPLSAGDIYPGSIGEFVDLSDAGRIILRLDDDVGPVQTQDAIDQLRDVRDQQGREVELLAGDGTVLALQQADGTFIQTKADGSQIVDVNAAAYGQGVLDLISGALQKGHGILIRYEETEVLAFYPQERRVRINLSTKSGRPIASRLVDHIAHCNYIAVRPSGMGGLNLDIVRPDGANAIDGQIHDTVMGIFRGTNSLNSVRELSSAGRPLVEYRKDHTPDGSVDYEDGEHLGLRIRIPNNGKLTPAAERAVVSRNARLMSHSIGGSPEDVRFVFEMAMNMAKINSYHGHRPYGELVVDVGIWDRAMQNMLLLVRQGKKMTLSRVVDIIKNQSFPAGMSDMVGAMVAQRINSAEFILGLAHREYDNIMGEIIKLFLGPKGKRIIITGSGFGLTLRLRDHNARVSSGARVALSTISAIKMAMERNPDCNGGVFYIIPETMTARGRTTPDFAWINGSTAVYLEAKGTRNGDRAGEQVKKGIRQLMGTHVAPEVDQLVRFGGKTIGGRFVMLDVTGTSGSHQGICDAIVDTFKGIESEIRRNNLPIDQIADQLRSVRGIEVLVTYDDALWGVKYDPMLRRYQVMRLHSSRKKGETKVRAAHHAMSGL